MSPLPHLDELTGQLAGIAQLVRPRVLDTTGRLGVYEGLSLETLFPAPQHAPPVHRKRRWRIGGIESEDLWFPSLHEPLEPEFRRHYTARRRRLHTVWARRLRPDGVSGRPRLLYVHGYMQPETVVEEVVLLAALARRLDAEVVQIQPPYHGRRKPSPFRFDGELFWTADVVRSVESLRQTVLDARTLLAWMRSEGSEPVGISGVSLGGAFAAALTCLEPGFAFSVPLVAHMDLGRVTADAPVLAAMRRDLARFGWTPEDFAAFIDRTGWNALRPRLPKERILLFAASDDHFFRPELVEAMWRRWGEPAIVWYPASHMGFFRYLPDVMRRMRAFVDAVAEGKRAPAPATAAAVPGPRAD